MTYLSVKEANNRSIITYKKSNLFSFMDLSNQRLLTKKIYILHKSNNGFATYLYFKDIIPLRMKEWVTKVEVNKYNELVLGGSDVLEYLNKKFITENYDLYSENSPDYMPFETNVYKSKISVSYPTMDNSSGIIVKKRPDELLADDYKNIDVWGEQVENLTDKNYRYQNKIPFWQRTMNIRHYDRSNQGYHHSNPNRASLDVPIYGNKNEMSTLIKLLDEKNKRYKMPTNSN